MNWLHTATTIVHVLLAVAIVALVLVQRGKGAEAGAGFGAGASGTVFGARGAASFFSRLTAALAALFIATSLTLAYVGGRRPEAPRSVLDRVQVPQEHGSETDAPPALDAEPRSESAPAAESNAPAREPSTDGASAQQ
ncbi:MAG TPA: preprotein translocase subunit SecG [Steroidobacter sp.]